MHQQTYSFPPTLVVRSREALIRSVIWSFVGLLYGMLFVFFAELAKIWDLPMHPYFFSGVLAGTIGALIYSSMRLAVLLAIVISPICVLYFVFSQQVTNPTDLLVIVVPAGALIGAFYGFFSTASRVYRADAKILTGFSAGFLISLCYLMLSNHVGDVPVGMVIGLMCPLTGALYVLFVPTFIRFRDNLLPPLWDGAMVGMGVAFFLAFSFFVFINGINTGPAGTSLPMVQQIIELLPQAAAGGALGGGFMGFLSGLLLTRWQNL